MNTLASKILLFCLLWMSFCSALQAQDKIIYRYDLAGNRISRTIVMAPRSAPVSTKEESPVVYTEKIADIQLKIYPNPTDGRLRVEIQNLPEGQTARIWIYAMSGQLITSSKAVSNTVNMDISGQPAGIYLMQIVAGEYRTEWKIIKK